MVHLCMHKVFFASSAGAVVLIFGVFLGWYGFPYMLNKNVAEQISLFPASEAMQRWMEIPFPLEFKVYFFNVTNADKVQIGERPILEEIGPYVFDLYKSKVNVSFDKTNDTINYMAKNKFYFNEEKSLPNKLDDKLVLINLPLMGTTTMVERLFPMGLSFVNKAIPYLFPNITDMFLRATAKQFMYEGVLINCSYATGPAMPVCNGMRGKLPATVAAIPDSKDFKFSFFRHKNETLEGPFKIYGGNQDISKLGQIIEYKSSNNLSMWDQNTTCNQLKGTDSTIFPPIYNYMDDIFIYVPDVCLTLAAVYQNQSVINDITIYRYESSENNFADSSSVPENICRCLKNEDPKAPPICLKKGAIEASSCQGVPVIFTQPHFLDADPEYTEYPEGLKPDKDKHLTYVLIEPKTGAPVIGKKRLQMNIFLKKIEDISLLANVSEGLFPVAWVEEGGEINKESMKKLNDLYYILYLLEIAKWVLIAIGLIILFIAFIMYAKYRRLLCFNGNQVSQFSYGVNTFHIESKLGNDRSKTSVLNSPNEKEKDDSVVQSTVSNKLDSTQVKSNELYPNTALPS